MNTTELTDKLKTTKPLQTLAKNWISLAALGVLIALWQWDALPGLLRAIVMVPMYLFIALSSYLLLRSVFCRHTTDALGDDKKSLREGWNDMTPADRIKLLIHERCAFIIAAALIIHGMLCIYGGMAGAAASQ